MKIHVTQVFVDDQQKALEFYTEKLGFELKNDVPVGEHRWLTVVSPEDPDGPELLLEASSHPAVPPYKVALVKDNIPAHSFAVEDIEADYQKLQDRGVSFTLPITDAGSVKIAVFDDTCGNLIQIVEEKDEQ